MVCGNAKASLSKVSTDQLRLYHIPETAVVPDQTPPSLPPFQDDLPPFTNPQPEPHNQPGPMPTTAEPTLREEPQPLPLPVTALIAGTYPAIYNQGNLHIPTRKPRGRPPKKIRNPFGKKGQPKPDTTPLPATRLIQTPNIAFPSGSGLFDSPTRHPTTPDVLTDLEHSQQAQEPFKRSCLMPPPPPPTKTQRNPTSRLLSQLHQSFHGQHRQTPTIQSDDGDTPLHQRHNLPRADHIVPPPYLSSKHRPNHSHLNDNKLQTPHFDHKSTNVQLIPHRDNPHLSQI